MTAINEGNYLGDLLKYEAPNLYSRESVTIASGADLTLGTVLGKITASGKYAALDPAETDGSEVAVAVLLEDAAAASADVTALVVLRHSIVADHIVGWPSGITPTEQATATGELEARGILIRKGA